MTSRTNQKEGKYMYANYHTHTFRCNHAFGTEREFVETAIKSGLKKLGFADHTPYPFPKPEEYSWKIRMRMDELEDYVNTVLALRDEYRNDIEIHLGLEVEYYPTFFHDLLKAVSDYPIEYMLLAQHYLGNSETGECYCAWVTTDPNRLVRYCSQIIEAMDTGVFTYLAHPDLLNFTGDSDLYTTQMRRLCQSAKAHGLPLEINFLGISANRHYPNETFWKIAGEEGCDVVFGLDAHKTNDFLFESSLEIAHKMVKRYQLHLLEDIEFRKPIP